MFENEEILKPAWETASYEALWIRFDTLPKLAGLFEKHRHGLPSVIAKQEGISEEEIKELKSRLPDYLPFEDYEVLFYGDFEYPERLKSLKNPPELLYFQGNLDLLSSKSLSVVGARKVSPEGAKRAEKLAAFLVDHGFTVMSGLAEGIDTAAHRAAIAAGGQTIGVIGTPLNETYPRQNRELQKTIREKFLLLSEVPFHSTAQHDYRRNRMFFPERNKLMAALSEGTVIVEASETSGSLIQARSALQQGRKLFILNSCFSNGLKWPKEYLKRGAVRVESGEEILAALKE